MEISTAPEEEATAPAKVEFKQSSSHVVFKKEDFETAAETGQKTEESEEITDAHEAKQFFTAEQFSELQLPEFLQKNLLKLNYERTTPIQSKFLKIYNNAGNYVVSAPTGAGKSLAVLIPLIQRFYSEKRTLKVLIVSPTRELSEETHTVLQKLLNETECVASAISGGISRESEKSELRKGQTFLCATPGRLIDHLDKTESLKSHLETLEVVVFDECDELMEMGEEALLHKLIQLGKQKIILSATIGTRLLSLVNKELKDPVLVKADLQTQNIFTLPDELRQEFTVVPTKARLAVLFGCIAMQFNAYFKAVTPEANAESVDQDDRAIIESTSLLHKLPSILIFTQSRNQVEFLLETAEKLHLAFSTLLPSEIAALHGGMEEEVRQKVFSQFEATGGILFATDVAARGLNLNSEKSGVDYVIEYDAPCNVEQYVHRAGRSARAGNTGHSVLFLLESEVAIINIIIESTKQKISFVASDLFGQILGFRVSVRAFEKLQSQVEQLIREDEDYAELARQAFLQFMKGYSSRDVEVRSAFPVKQLHSGHVAKSFGLAEAPSEISGKQRQEKEDKSKKSARDLTETKKGDDRHPRRSTKVQKGDYDERGNIM